MPPPGNKASTPFKSMDIKTALLLAGNRKRKTPPSPVCKSESKSLKLSTDTSDHENDMEIPNEDCGIAITIEQSERDANLGDCKENKDINSTDIDTSVSECKGNKDITSTEIDSSIPDCIENKQISAKLDFSPFVNKTSPSVSKQDSSKSSQSEVDSDSNAEQSCEMSKNSENSSCDELNTSLNVSLNTSGLSVTCEDENDNKGSNSKSNNSCSEKTGGKTTKEDSKKVKKKKMTPAEAQKRAKERELKQKEMMLKKQELENKKRERILEKERKMKEKQIQKEREEFEKKERERIKQEKKEQEEKEKLLKQKEREEKLKMKQIIQENKLEEKKRKEEMKLKKEEELKKAEEEKQKAKLEKEQKEKEKQERAKAAFAKFFVKPNSNSSVPAQPAEKKVAFLPFQISDDMTLAPVVPLAAQERFDKNQLDYYLKCQDAHEVYLQILKCGSYKDVRHRKKNRKLGAAEADVIVIDKNDQAELGLCPKLLQFHENVRPPYWGTWRKKSKNIRPRNPFGEDEILDYSVDSDDEWDEGGPGESLSGTEPEDESEDDYEVDNEFFVPHGYLSDEEAKKEDDDEEVNDPEKQKALLKQKLHEFEMERKKKTTELKPVILGCYFVNNPAFQDSGLQIFLQSFAAEMLSDTPIPTNFTVKSQQGGSGSSKNESPKSSNSNSIKKKKLLLVLPEEAFPQLIRLVHGNTNNKRSMAEEFQKFWLEQPAKGQEVKEETNEPSSKTGEVVMKELAYEHLSESVTISLKLLKQTIREIASYGKSPDSTFNKYCWWVHEEIREKYGLMDIPLPNQWKYVSLKESEPPVKVNCASIKEFLSHN